MGVSVPSLLIESTDSMICTSYGRVKGGSMQTNPPWYFRYRSTLGKIETTLQICEILEKVCENAIYNTKS